MKQAKTGRHAAYYRPLRSRDLRMFFAHLPCVVGAGKRTAASLDNFRQALEQLRRVTGMFLEVFRARS